MANILLDKSHNPLLKAASRLGDWLLSLDALTDDDKQAVRAVQKALEKLPKLNDGTLAMYGFSLEQGDETNGLVRGWDVSLEYFASDSERQGGLELFSSYIPIPETTDADVLALKKQNEVYFHWPVGDICNLVKPEQAKQWTDAVAEPESLRQAGQRLRIEIVFGDYYGEVELG
jgi:hypothetical protein